jgi:diguanylate cyclase (GGDEF)-like protein/PAS domain S-box-containing protein
LTTILGLTCLLLALAGAYLLRQSRRQRAELDAVEDLTKQLHRALRAPATDSGTRLRLDSDEQALQSLKSDINQLLGRYAAAMQRQESTAALFGALADRVRDIVVVYRDGIQFANQPFAALIGIDRTQLVGRPLEELVAPEFAEFVQETLQRLQQGDRAADRFEVELVGFQAQYSRLELVCRSIDWDGGSALLITGVEILYTAQPAALHAAPEGPAVYGEQEDEEDLRQRLEDEESELLDAGEFLDAERLEASGSSLVPVKSAAAADSPERLTLDSLAEAVLTIDTAGRIEYLNPAAERLLGVTVPSAQGHELEQVLALADQTESRVLGDAVMRTIATAQPVALGRRAVALRRKDGTERSVELSIAPLSNAYRQTLGAVLMLHDVSELRGMTRQMTYQAAHDALTGLVNRREFERRVDAAVGTARRGESSHVLCFIDLDRFKAVNDTSGHLAGDALLREIAKLLREAVRDSDTVARLGGDEFGLLLTGCPLDKAHQISQDLTRAIGEYRFIWKERVFNIGASIGLLELGRESGSVEESIAAADSACYVAKAQGSGNVAVYSAREESVARRSGEIQWLQKLQAALRDETFELYQQPIVPAVVASADGPALEVLLRLRDEEGKVWQPQDFLVAAERYRLMPGIDRWVVSHTIEKLASGQLVVPNSRCVTLNVSGQTLGDIGFLEFVVDCLDRSGVPPAQLCFEMTEAAVIANLEHARRFADVLHGMGCRFALDNFGSGVGSFSNLKNLPLDYLKIDRSVTRHLARDSVNQAMVSAMVKLARTLNFHVIAEGIEDNASLDQVRRMGVDFVQGNVIARARPLSAAA